LGFVELEGEGKKFPSLGGLGGGGVVWEVMDGGGVVVLKKRPLKGRKKDSGGDLLFSEGFFPLKRKKGKGDT